MKANAVATPNGKPASSSRPIAAGVSIGHFHLKVANLERAIDFYAGVLGFELTERYGRNAAFLSAGGYHHHIGLNTWGSQGGQPPPPSATGLYHAAILYPTRADLADALRRLLAHGIRIASIYSGWIAALMHWSRRRASIGPAAAPVDGIRG
jgi:catechol 2,3-dioxygenase